MGRHGGDELTPGESLSGFMFDSTLTPQDLAGLSSIHPGTPILTSFTYSGAPFSDPGFSFVVTEAAAATAPEPTTCFLFGEGFIRLALSAADVPGIPGISPFGESDLHQKSELGTCY